VTDPQLTEKFQAIYTAPSVQVPWYMSIGNHDCEGSIQAMLDYADQDSNRWYMPARYYTKDEVVDETTIVRFVVIDGCDLVCGSSTDKDFRCIDKMITQSSPASRKEQYAWIERVLASPAPPQVKRMWKIVVGHWGVFSHVGSGDTADLIQNLLPLMKKHQVHIYFSGHDHALQHIHHKHKQQQQSDRDSDSDEWEPHFFVSGAGGYVPHSARPSAYDNDDLLSLNLTNGFMWVVVDSKALNVKFVEATGGTTVYQTQVLFGNV